VNLSVKSYIFNNGLAHILSVIFVKTFSVVTMHDHTAFQQQVVSETLCGAVYEGKSLNDRNAILKCMKNYSQGKILFRDTKWLLSSMSYRGLDDPAVCACAVVRTTVNLRCGRATKRYSFSVVRGCETI